MTTFILHQVSSHAIKPKVSNKWETGDSTYLPYLQDNVNVRGYAGHVSHQPDVCDSEHRAKDFSDAKNFFLFLFWSCQRIACGCVKFVLSRSKNDGNSMHLLQPVCAGLNKKMCASSSIIKRALFLVLYSRDNLTWTMVYNLLFSALLFNYK